MKKRSLALLIFCLLLTGCAARADGTPHTRTVFAMDTVMNLNAYGENGEIALDAAEKGLYRLDAALARGTEGSAVHELNRFGTAAGTELAYLARNALAISEAADGAFDVTVAPVLELWGFGSGAGERRVPEKTELAAALEHVGAENLHVGGETDQVTLDLPAQIDLGGIAKGYAALCVRQQLMAAGVTSAVIDLGGDVCLAGKKPDGSPWRVAVRDPADGAKFLGVLEASDVCVMTSGVYERYFEKNGVRYHHIIDPKTGCPAQSGLVSATVVCADGVWADALATAACVRGADGALALRERLADETPFDLILVTEDGNVIYTCDGFTPESGNGYTYEKIA